MLLAGAVLDQPPGRTYVEHLRFAEFVFNPSLPKLPKTNTLARWRRGLPEGFQCTLRALRVMTEGDKGYLRLDDGLRARLQTLAASASALQASAVVLQTTRALTPSRKNRERLRAYVQQLQACIAQQAHSQVHVVWEPSGLWEPEEIAGLCNELCQGAPKTAHVYPAFDPLRDPCPDTSFLYARLTAIGARQRLSEGMLYEVATALHTASPTAQQDQAHTGYVAIESPRSYNEAKQLQSLIAMVASHQRNH